MTDVEYFKGYNLITVDSGFQIRAKKIIYCIGYESKNLIKEHFVNLKVPMPLFLKLIQKI
jgi:hypothetical protein